MTSAARYFKNYKLDYPNAETNKASKKYVKAMKKLPVRPATMHDLMTTNVYRKPSLPTPTSTGNSSIYYDASSCMIPRSESRPRRLCNTLGSRNRSWTMEQRPTRSSWSGRRRPAGRKKSADSVNSSDSTEAASSLTFLDRNVFV